MTAPDVCLLLVAIAVAAFLAVHSTSTTPPISPEPPASGSPRLILAFPTHGPDGSGD